MSFFDITSQVQRWLAYQRTKAELSRLSEHQLRDIGLMPADIEGRAWTATKADGASNPLNARPTGGVAPSRV